MSPKAASDFETAVFEWISATYQDSALREQLAHVRVIDRDYTVVGCYSKLLVRSGTPPSKAPYSSRGPLTGPGFESSVVDYGGLTLLWFKAGYADCLEIFAMGDYFPADHSELGAFKLMSSP